MTPPVQNRPQNEGMSDYVICALIIGAGLLACFLAYKGLEYLMQHAR